ncbi:isoprenoid synthase domain-containing protein [Hysterangium stoloniferum]|nr:isoprenoid synthase domain-containing protein [Hysterangium stoloniferum]
MTTSTTNSISMVPSKPKMEEVISMIQRYLSDYQFTHSGRDYTNIELEASMRSEMESHNIQCIELEKSLHYCATFTEGNFRDCTLAEKKNFALYSWYLIYIDDIAPTFTVAIQEFQKRFFRGQPQLHPVLTALVQVFNNIWELYDPVVANYIMASSFDFISWCCIEHKMRTMPLIKGIERLPWFIREKSGVAAGWILHAFPKSRNFTMTDVLQALPDMCYWVNLSNDLLSFYKEELAGEKDNYVHLRADAENLSPLEVLATIVEEMRIARNTIHATLMVCPPALDAWKVYEQGYLEWHLTSARYRLTELVL